MDFFIQNLITYLVLYKYLTIFAISFLAAFILPIPSGSLLMGASAYARFGYFDIYIIFLISVVANILGDNLSYLMARKYGYGFLSKIGFKKVLNSESFHNLKEKYNNRPGFIIFASRFEVLSTLSVNLLSGVSKTPYSKFFIHEVTGTFSQVFLYSSLGYFFAESWESINSTIGRVMLVLFFVFVLILISFGKKRLKNIFNKKI